MKNLFKLTLLLSLLLSFNSCHPAVESDLDFEGELVAFQDTKNSFSKGSLSGGFIYVRGNYYSSEKLSYGVYLRESRSEEIIRYVKLDASRTNIIYSDSPRLIVKCNNVSKTGDYLDKGTVKEIENIILHYQRSIDGVANCISDYTTTLYIPEGSIVYDNEFDGI